MSDLNLLDNSVGSEYILADPLFGSDPALYPLFIDVNNMPASADLPVGSNTGSTNVSIGLLICLLYFNYYFQL